MKTLKQLKYSEAGFRAFYHNFFLVPLTGKLKMVFAGYPEYEQAEYALTYGYIDHTAGMTLEVMAAAIRREDGKGVRLEDMNLRLASKIRIGVAKDKDCYILDDKLTKCAHEWYREHIERLSDYDVGPEIEETRKMKFLDECRSPEYPDDVLVYLVPDEGKIEGGWVRIEGIVERHLKGILLNEPDQDFSCHKGDLIEFSVNQMEDGQIVLCAGLESGC